LTGRNQSLQHFWASRRSSWRRCSIAVVGRSPLNPQWPSSKTSATLLPVATCTQWDGMSVLERTCHGKVVKLRRAFSRRCLVNYLAVRPGSIANRNRLQNRLQRPTSSCHGRSAEAGGKAKSSSQAGGKLGGISPESIDYIIVNRWNAGTCARFSLGEDRQARESRQQLQRWLRIQPPTRQGSLGWMQRRRNRERTWTFLVNMQRQPQLQILRGLHGDQGILGRAPQSSLLVL
jgi:hypothetical protein